MNELGVKKPDDLSDKPLKVLCLSTHAYHVLRRAGIDTISELQGYSDEALLRIRNLGETLLQEIRSKQEQLNLDNKLGSESIDCKPVVWTNTTFGKKSIYHCGLSFRTANALNRAGIKIIDDLSRKNRKWLLSIQNIGGKAMAEIDILLDSIEIKKLPVFSSDHTRSFLLEMSNSSVYYTAVAPLSTLGLSAESISFLMKKGIKTIRDLYLCQENYLVPILQIQAPHISQEIFNVWQKLRETIQGDYIEKAQQVLVDHGILQLPSDWSWRYFLSIGLDWQVIQNIEDSLIAEDLFPLEKLPEGAIIESEILEFLIRVGCPLYKIPSMRATSNQNNRQELLAYGIETVLDICLLNAKQIDQSVEDPEIFYADVDYYLQQLPSLNWETEINNTNPCLVSVWRLSGVSLRNYWEVLLSDLKQRDRDILLARLPLEAENVSSLKDLGKRHGITRTRIQQIERRTKSFICDILPNHEICVTVKTLARKIVLNQGMIDAGDLAETMSELYALQDEGLQKSLEELFHITGSVSYYKSSRCFVSPEIPVDLLRKLESYLYTQLRKAKAPILEKDLASGIIQDLFKEDIELSKRFDLCKKILEYSDTFERVEDRYWGLRAWENRVLDEIVMALREADEPTHFRYITRLANKRLSQDQQTTPRATHAKLGNHKDLFMRTGPGTFGLREWDPDSPNQPPKYRDLMKQVLIEAGKPLKMDAIHKKVDDLRTVKMSTVIMYLTMHEDFVGLENGYFGLSDWDMSEDKQAIAYEQLPEGFRKRLEARARRAFANREREGKK